MPTDVNSRLLSAKIADFCQKRLTPFLLADTERLQTYLVDLISRGEYPPTRGRGVDWRTIACDCGIDHLRLSAIKEEVRPALDAIARAFDAVAARETRPRFALQGGIALGEANLPKPRASAVRRARPQPDLFAANDPGEAVDRLRPTRKRGVKPKIVVDFPQAIDNRWEDPASFREALVLHMQRHGEAYWHLHRAIVDAGESFDIKTIRSWVQGTRSPATTDSMAILQRIERRYRLEPAILRRISKPRPTLADQISPADTRTSKLESAGRNASGKGSDSKCRSLRIKSFKAVVTLVETFPEPRRDRRGSGCPFERPWR